MGVKEGTSQAIQFLEYVCQMLADKKIPTTRGAATHIGVDGVDDQIHLTRWSQRQMRSVRGFLRIINGEIMTNSVKLEDLEQELKRMKSRVGLSTTSLRRISPSSGGFVVAKRKK